jgi:hypothetical protein
MDEEQKLLAILRSVAERDPALARVLTAAIEHITDAETAEHFGRTFSLPHLRTVLEAVSEAAPELLEGLCKVPGRPS